MKASYKIILTLLLFLCFTACDNSAAEFGSVIELREGETVVMADNTEVLLKLIQDSRCPSDVDCFWEGRAGVTLEISRSSTQNGMELKETIELNDVEYITVDLSDYRFEFIELTPYPEVDSSTKGTLLRFKITLN